MRQGSMSTRAGRAVPRPMLPPSSRSLPLFGNVRAVYSWNHAPQSRPPPPRAHDARWCPSPNARARARGGAVATGVRELRATRTAPRSSQSLPNDTRLERTESRDVTSSPDVLRAKGPPIPSDVSSVG
eukprot:2588044-Prymnesium_polylepis.2